MQTVIIHGIHTLNVGDDLFFHIVRNRYPNVRFVMVASDAYKRTFGERWDGIIVTEKNFMSKVSSAIGKLFKIPSAAMLYAWLLVRYRVDLFMIVGGSLFMEGKSRMPSFISGICKMRKLRPKLKITIIGSNFGPCYTEQWKAVVGSALKKVDDICFRDEPSFNEFSYLPNVRWANDIVMHLKPLIGVPKERAVCVNIRSVDNWPSLKPYKEQYLNMVKEFIYFFQYKGYSIKLISFCKEYGDNEITFSLYDMLENKESVEIYYYDGDLDKTLDLISRSEFMIGTRFHAIVLGLIYNLKVLPISYSVKTENMLKSYNLWKESFDFGKFCSSDFQSLYDSFIDGFRIDGQRNKMFSYTDVLLN